MIEGDELLPCPFCGGAPALLEKKDGTYYIACEGCDIDYGFQKRHENPLYLIRLWNERVENYPE